MNNTDPAGQTAGQIQRTRRERLGLSLPYLEAVSLVKLIADAEQEGVAQLWLNQDPDSDDALVVCAVALQRTERIRLGTAIVPAYPRHPLALAQEVWTAAAFGADRLRLGVGPSHRRTIGRFYGLTMQEPLKYMEEYVQILRAALWNGSVDYSGHFLTAKAKLNNVPHMPIRMPILLSALGRGAFRLAGEISDGAISWNCPFGYLREVALPALREGASAAGRTAPPLVAHLWVALGMDRDAAREVARKILPGYARQPFYANMWAAAGFPVQPEGGVSDALVDSLVASGDEQEVAARVDEYLGSGMDELMLTSLYPDDATDARTRLLKFVGGL